MFTDYIRSLNDPLTNAIRLLNTLAIALKKNRIKAGALSLSSPELKIHLDSSESAEPIDVEQKQPRETNSLVEEFMLLANISVARKIQDSFPGTAVLREAPSISSSSSRPLVLRVPTSPCGLDKWLMNKSSCPSTQNQL